NITTAAYVEEIVAVPTRAFTKEEGDWAVAFAIPTDTKGVKHLAVSKAPTEKGPSKNPFVHGLPSPIPSSSLMMYSFPGRGSFYVGNGIRPRG
ncbi:MAG: 4-hydroxyphenylacetate 3-hydroxylase N-terminal domain-containing protein, partial [Pseudomonadota bacterium]